MIAKHSPLHLICLLFVCILLNCSYSHASLHSYVKKHKNTKVTKGELKKLAEYDHLIRYFSNFSYFIPGHKVSPNFIRALILAESGGNRHAVSHKAAVGLGQILFSTGKEAAKRLAQSETPFRYVSQEKLLNLQREDLFDPAINILLTCYLVAKYNYKFDGKLHLVVSAWNAGEYTKSLRHGQHAPYRETENLIGKVNALYLSLLEQKI